MMIQIAKSVGIGGRNILDDVKVVQSSLKIIGLSPGPIDGKFGPKTKTAILGFQHGFLSKPDGLIVPNGKTIQRLSQRVDSAKPAPQPPSVAPATLSQLVTDWTGDSSQWPQDKKLNSLSKTFKIKIEKVILQLTNEGFQPKIVFGWRSTAVQKQLVAEGKSRILFSFHNAQTPQGVPNAWAVDVIDRRWGWNEPECMKFFNALGRLGKQSGLVWGGDWTDPRDWAHLQGRANSELSLVKKESGL